MSRKYDRQGRLAGFGYCAVYKDGDHEWLDCGSIFLTVEEVAKHVAELAAKIPDWAGENVFVRIARVKITEIEEK